MHQLGNDRGLCVNILCAAPTGGTDWSVRIYNHSTTRELLHTQLFSYRDIQAHAPVSLGQHEVPQPGTRNALEELRMLCIQAPFDWCIAPFTPYKSTVKRSASIFLAEDLCNFGSSECRCDAARHLQCRQTAARGAGALFVCPVSTALNFSRIDIEGSRHRSTCFGQQCFWDQALLLHSDMHREVGVVH